MPFVGEAKPGSEASKGAIGTRMVIEEDMPRAPRRGLRHDVGDLDLEEVLQVSLLHRCLGVPRAVEVLPPAQKESLIGSSECVFV